MDIAAKSGLHGKNVIHKTAEVTGELVENKITEKNVKPKPMSVSNSKNNEEINIVPEKEKYYKIEHCKISKLLDESTVSNFVTRKCIEVNSLSGGQCSATKKIMFKTHMLRSYL